MLHGSTVGDGALIGMNATVLNGAAIGAGSLVAANALVLEGTEVPPGSLVAGAPAKVRRPMTTTSTTSRQSTAAPTTTYGAGFTNAYTTLAEARLARIPLVFVVGDAPASGRRPFGIDQAKAAEAAGVTTLVARPDNAAAIWTGWRTGSAPSS